jgi:hypothetical protein
VLVFALALQACSTVKLAYNQAPTLAYLYLSGFIDFNDTQAAQLKAELSSFQAWHRQSQLPAYIELLQKVQQKLPQNLTANQACDVFAQVRQKVLRMSDQAEPAATSLVATLTQNQLEVMARKFAKTNAKWREDFVEGSASEVAEKRQNRAIKRSEMLYGSITESQRALIAQQLETSSFKASQNYAERQRRQKDTLQTLTKMIASPTPLEASRADMRGLLARSLNSPDKAYRDYAEQLTQDSCSSFAELHNTTTPEQRKKAVRVLAAYEQDFKTLLAQK